MKKNVNLARPAYPGEPSMAATQEGPEYPQLHLDGKEELDLPEHGTITFQYKLRSETSSKNKDGSHRYQCTLDIEKLNSVQARKDERPSKRDTSTEDNLDRLMKEKESESGGENDGDEKGEY